MVSQISPAQSAVLNSRPADHGLGYSPCSAQCSHHRTVKTHRFPHAEVELAAACILYLLYLLLAPLFNLPLGNMFCFHPLYQSHFPLLTLPFIKVFTATCGGGGGGVFSSLTQTEKLLNI